MTDQRTPKTVIVTGGAGFIGSAVVRLLIAETDAKVIVLDKLTYAANLASLAEVSGDPRYVLERADICDGEAVQRILREHRPDLIMHLAAESHVDRSIDGPAAFIETNVVGTYTLLDATRGYWQELEGDARRDFRFQHISTDEVYGSLGNEGFFTESTAYDPRSPYSASKASSDHLVSAWHHTYGLPTVLTNCSNNYGPYHFPEKLIPLMIIKGLAGEQLPVYGTGENVRDWLHVEDHARALWCVGTRGVAGRSYNIGGNAEVRNIDVVKAICSHLDAMAPRDDGKSRTEQITFVTDRPGHDFRYAIDPARIRDELGWEPSETFESGLSGTVRWYLDRRDWWQPILDGTYSGERLGVSAARKAG